MIAPAPWAQQLGEPPDSEDPASRSELREAMRRFYENRLRQELQLSDDKMAEILPNVDELERLRQEFNRDRSETARSLQRGLREGATDAEMAELLETLESTEERHRIAEREVRTRIDAQLTVRQQVQFRFFTERFRQELQRRIQQMRDRRGSDRDRPEGRRRSGERP
jgi:hypothetical protein